MGTSCSTFSVLASPFRREEVIPLPRQNQSVLTYCLMKYHELANCWNKNAFSTHLFAEVANHNFNIVTETACTYFIKDFIEGIFELKSQHSTSDRTSVICTLFIVFLRMLWFQLCNLWLHSTIGQMDHPYKGLICMSLNHDL